MKVIVISGVCCNGNCKRVPVVAKQFSDGWIALCDKCSGGSTTLNKSSLDKICAAVDKTKELAKKQ